jgi:hypothetical protein
MASPTTDRRGGLIGNTPIKAPVDCATTVNITLSGEQTIDGVVTSQSRVLVWNQTDRTQNGIYNSGSAAWTRADDADGNYDLVNGTFVQVTGGTTNGGYVYRVSAANPVQPGASAINFILGLFSSIIAAAFIASGTGAITRNAQDKLRDEVSVKDFGAVGDGVSRQISSLATLGTLSVAGWTLPQWQAVYPHVTALTNQLDWVAGQAAVNTGKTVKWPYGSYVHDQPLSAPTPGQKLDGNGKAATITFNLAAAGPGILLSGTSGQQQVFGFNLILGVNCSAGIEYSSPQVQLMFNTITAVPAGSLGIKADNEDLTATPQKFCFGAMIGYNFIHGSSSVGSRGIRLGLNSQQSSIFWNVIDNFETCIAVPRNTDTLLIEQNTLENVLSTGHGIDMRCEASTSTYQAVTIRGNHFEDLYSAICWGTTGIGSSGTYTSVDIHGNKFVGHAGGTNYFLTINGVCGAGSQNNRVAYNDVQDNLTFCFNFNDAAGAQSIIDRKGNTVPAGKWATGSQSIYAYTIREVNAFFGSVLTAGSAFASTSNTRMECAAALASYSVALPWYSGEYLESIQWTFLPIGSTPTVNGALTSVNGDTTTTVTSTGVTSGTSGVKKLITLPVDTVAVQGLGYFMFMVHTLGGGTTAYDYPLMCYFRF